MISTLYRQTYAFHVEVEDVLEVGWEAGEQRVVAPVVSEVSNSNGPDRHRRGNGLPWNFHRGVLRIKHQRRIRSLMLTFMIGL